MPLRTPFLTEREAADYLRLAVGTLQNKRLAGTGPAYLKSSSRIVYREDALVAWAERGNSAAAVSSTLEEPPSSPVTA